MQPPKPPLESGSAPLISGVTPDDEAISVDPSRGDVDLLFLTSDCRECRQCWARAAAGEIRGVRDVIVTPDPATDSRRSVARLAPEGAVVVMSSAAWHAFGVTKAPWRVQVRAGAIVSSAPALPA